MNLYGSSALTFMTMLGMKIHGLNLSDVFVYIFNLVTVVLDMYLNCAVVICAW